MTTYRSRLPCWLCVVDDILRECVRGPRCAAVQEEVVDNGAPGSEREGEKESESDRGDLGAVSNSSWIRKSKEIPGPPMLDVVRKGRRREDEVGGARNVARDLANCLQGTLASNLVVLGIEKKIPLE